MKKLIKFEENFNKIAIRLIEIISKLIQKLVPEKVKLSVHKIASRIKSNRQLALEKIKEKKQKALESTKKLREINLKEKVKLAEVLLNQKVETIRKIGPKSYFAGWGQKILKQITRPILWLEKKGPGALVLALVICCILLLSSLKLYLSGKQIYTKYHRAPASIQENKYGVRPAYYKQDLKQYQMGQFRVPIYIGEIGGGQQKALQIEFTVQSSNKYTKQYLEKHDHVARDYVIMGLEPLIPEFPLTEEGKVIIKERVRAELNQLLKDHKIEGQVIEVYIVDIITN